MFSKIEEHESEIFKTICTNKDRIQDCTISDINIIFGKEIARTQFDQWEKIEDYYKCTGVTDRSFHTYYFTKRR